jgi:glutamate/tyrosine decarboxylase-like PLP-dependent enzyme
MAISDSKLERRAMGLERGGGDPFSAVFPALDHAQRRAREFLTTLTTRPVGARATAAELDAAFAGPLPEQGCDASVALDDWLRRGEAGLTASPGPRFFGFVLGGSVPAALAADWLTSALDQMGGIWVSSPAASHTEAAAIRWLQELFGLPSDWAGTITSGATMANLVGLAAARQWAGTRLGFNAALDGLAGNPSIPVLSSTEIHGSAVKALGTLGFGRSSVRKLAAPNASLDLDALSTALAEIDGPAILIANAGDVNTGRFDDLNAITDRCAAHLGGVWIHVDGAFGLFARLSPATAHYLDGIERVDSIAADAHKWLNVPYDSGFVFVRDLASLVGAFSTSAAYLEPPPGAGRDYDDFVPEMSRRFRALAVWCALRSLGHQGYREIVERCLSNAAEFGRWIERSPGVELMAPVTLNIVCFRYTPGGLSDDDRDTFNKEAVSAIQRDGRVFVTPTVWNGRSAIRCAFDNWSTTLDDVRILQEAVSDIGGKLIADRTS